MERSAERNAGRPPAGCLRSVLRGFARALEVPVFFTCMFVFVAFAAGVYGAMEPRSIDMDAVLGEPDEAGNVIPDFSSVGYMGGGVELPDVPAVKTLYPGSGACDRERIQSALDKIGRMEPCGEGFRGALLLRAGEYRVEGPLYIKESGVVLRGEGQFRHGTVIINTKADKRPMNEKRAEHSNIFIGDPTPPRTSVRLAFLEPEGAMAEITGRVPVGSRELPVKSVEGFAPGDKIVIDVRPNEKWLETLQVQDYWATWISHRYERRITGVSDGTLILDAPMVHYIEPEMFRKLDVFSYRSDPRISNSGVEHLRLKSVFTGADLRETAGGAAGGSNAISAVSVNRAKNCWVRNVTALHFQFAAVEIMHEARNITVQDCAFLRPVSYLNRGGDRYAFFIGGSSSLVQRCYARSARHAFASSNRCAGPNVFLDCLSENDYSDIGPHMRWDTGYLYDNVLAPAGRINVQHFTATHHRWRGANHVFWNCRSHEMICDQPRTGDVNWSIGNIASKRPGRVSEKPGVWKSYGRRVSPRSLYLFQLEERLGRDAVENITLDVQRQENSGKIYDYLKDAFSEPGKWELANIGNIIPDPDFRAKGRLLRWITTEKLEEPFDFDPYADDRKVFVDELERTRNPVFGCDSAVLVPAGRSLRTMPFGYLNFENPSLEEVDLILSFDYRMEEGGTISASVIHETIMTGVDEAGYGLFTYGTSRWEKTEVFTGPGAGGDGEWRRYSFGFTLSPVFFKDTGMPYPTVLTIKLSPGKDYIISNPVLTAADSR